MSATTIALLLLGPICGVVGWALGWGFGRAQNADEIGQQRERINALEVKARALGDEIRALAAAPVAAHDVERLLSLVSGGAGDDAA